MLVHSEQLQLAVAFAAQSDCSHPLVQRSFHSIHKCKATQCSGGGGSALRVPACGQPAAPRSSGCDVYSSSLPSSAPAPPAAASAALSVLARLALGALSFLALGALSFLASASSNAARAAAAAAAPAAGVA